MNDDRQFTPLDKSAASTLADKIEADGLCSLCDYGQNYIGHGERKVTPFPTDPDRDLIVKALRALSHSFMQSEKVSGWIDLNDRLPDDSPVEVITVSCDGEVVATRSAKWVRLLYADAKQNGELCSISHWMPLPEAP